MPSCLGGEKPALLGSRPSCEKCPDRTLRPGLPGILPLYRKKDPHPGGDLFFIPGGDLFPTGQRLTGPTHGPVACSARGPAWSPPNANVWTDEIRRETPVKQRVPSRLAKGPKAQRHRLTTCAAPSDWCETLRNLLVVLFFPIGENGVPPPADSTFSSRRGSIRRRVAALPTSVPTSRHSSCPIPTGHRRWVKKAASARPRGTPRAAIPSPISGLGLGTRLRRIFDLGLWPGPRLWTLDLGLWTEKNYLHLATELRFVQDQFSRNPGLTPRIFSEYLAGALRIAEATNLPGG